MSKYIKQYRFYGENDERNYPANLKSSQQLISGEIFESKIIDLRIQSYPGTKFYLNDSDINEWIMIGASGEYHLELSGNYEISFLRFDKSLNKYFNQQTYDLGLIIDIVYVSDEE